MNPCELDLEQAAPPFGGSQGERGAPGPPGFPLAGKKTPPEGAASPRHPGGQPSAAGGNTPRTSTVWVGKANSIPASSNRRRISRLISSVASKNFW